MSASPVYFTAVEKQDSQESVAKKLSLLLQESGAFGFLSRGDSVAVKLHFGEEGNTGHVRPRYAGAVCRSLMAKGAHPFLCDTNTLYCGRRMVSAEHLKLAREHGFTKEATGAEVLIPDDSLPENVLVVPIGARFIKQAKIARVFGDADALVGLAHFKGHMMTGFGGALKNIGMGCASREGKLAQHSDVSPRTIAQNCTGCGACVEVCPVSAITLVKNKSLIDSRLCIGCASCIAACAFHAIDVQWEAGGDLIQEKMVEYAMAALRGKQRKAFFLNFALKITKECDCLAKDDPAIAPDVGIFASSDPVSVDQASLDLVTQAAGKDVFRQAHPGRDAVKQLRHAESLGIGTREYKLIRIS